MRLFRKAATLLAVVLAVQLIGAVFLSWQALSSKSSVQHFRTHELPMTKDLRELGAGFWKYDDDMNNYAYYVVAHNQSIAQSFKSAAISDSLGLHRALTSIQSLAVPGSSIAITASRINRDVTGYDINSSRVYGDASAGKAMLAENQQMNGNGSVSNDLTAQLPKLAAEIQALSTSRINGVGTTQVTLIIASVVVSLLGILLVIALGVGFRRFVVAPLEAIKAYLDHMLHGTGSSPELDTERDDEFADLAKVVELFGDTVVGVVNATGHFAEQVKTLEDASQTIRSSAQGTASTSDAVNSSVDDVVDNVAAVVVSTDELREAIKEIADNAASAAGVARDAVNFAEGVSKEVGELGASVTEIESVISIINTIAEQTNLLALNAAIEAARAGEAGKGFAVVAGEVKELASGTQEATKEIRAKIDTMQRESQRTIASVDQVKSYILKISDLQNSIASAVEEQSVTTDEIGRMTHIATSSAESIATATHSLSAATSDTLTSANLAHEAAQGVDRASQELRSLTNKFVGVSRRTSSPGSAAEHRFRTTQAEVQDPTTLVTP